MNPSQVLTAIDLKDELKKFKTTVGCPTSIIQLCEFLLEFNFDELAIDEIEFFVSKFKEGANLYDYLKLLLCRIVDIYGLSRYQQLGIVIQQLDGPEGSEEKRVFGLLISDFKQGHLDARLTFSGLISEYRTNYLNQKFKTIQNEEKELAKRIETEQKRIDTQKSEINFIELNQAFQNLLAIKDKEANRAVITWLIFACLILITPFFLIKNILGPAPTAAFSVPLFTYYLPLVSTEFILFYFQRLAYHEYKSLKAQITQLEIRSAACQFIENYRKFAVDSSGSTIVDGKETANKFNLDKFEALIFSGLAVDPAAVPTAFDGIEQISKLIEAAKK